VVLEPGLVSPWWTAQRIGDAIVATGDLLKANGFTPRFVAPSSAGGANNALADFDTLARHSPSVFPYLKELAYHRYDTTDPYLPQLAARRAQYGVDTAQLEHIGADHHELHADLKVANVSAWQQYTLAYCVADDGSAYYNAGGSALTMASRTRYLRQYFKYVRAGAVRVGAETQNTQFDPVAFRNRDGRYVVVVKAAAGGSFTVAGLPAGTYGIKYTTGSQYNADLADATIASGAAVNASIPAAGVLTVYRK
jgi:hypothetical protein